MYDKKEYVIHIALKQALNHGLIFRKAHRVIQFNQEAWLKPYIEMNTKLRTDAKNDFGKYFFKINDIKLITTDKTRNQLVSEPNYHTT